jgi:hypothetical protein
LVAARPYAELDDAINEIASLAGGSPDTVDEALDLLDEIEGQLENVREALKPKADDERVADKLEELADHLTDIASEAGQVGGGSEVIDIETAIDRVEDLINAARSSLA